jgi:hypothetical protein
MINDQYANFVVQKFFDYVEPNTKIQMIDMI